MKRRYTNATLLTALLGLSVSSTAFAGDGQKGASDGQKGASDGQKGKSAAGAPAPGGAPMQAAIAAHLFQRMDENKDGQVTRQEAQDAAKRLFQRLDGNADGELTKAESEAGAKAIREQELSAHFKQLDANADGRLAAAEAQLPPGVFERLDANKDKALTLAEMQAGSEQRTERRDLQFEQSDANHDGKVTRDEADKSTVARFDGLDQNHDGSVSKAEVEAHVAQMLEQSRTKPQKGAH